MNVMRSRLLLSLALVLTLAARRRTVLPPPQSLDIFRSFVITEKSILDGFPFGRVLDELVARSGVTNVTAGQLYRQWFDTQNAKPGLADAAAPHCDDFMVDGKATFNGFARRCPTAEGPLAATPFGAGDYFPLALVNRFDLAPPDGSNCGQIRMIYARRAAAGTRLHIIFEAVMPNPNRAAGITGCKPLAQFWADQSAIASQSERRANLEKLFFEGVAGFPPVVDPNHFTAASGGGIRNTHMSSLNFIEIGAGSPRMYQFRIAKECNGSDCTLRIVPDVLENLPAGSLFDASVDTAQGRAFRDAFVEQVPNLAVHNVNEYFMEIPREFLIAESSNTDTEASFVFDGPFFRGSTTAPDFRNRIQAKLTSIGSTLRPEEVVRRAETLNCVGCHVLSGGVGEGLSFPAPMSGLQQVADNLFEPGENGPDSRFAISHAMRDVFIPHRMKILTDFLTYGKAPVRSETIGGNRRVQ